MSKIDKQPEGATRLDPDEMEGLLHKHIQTKGQLNELEHTNIQDGMQWLERQKSIDLFTQNFLRELHKKLFGQVWEWAGTFRRSAKNIGCDASLISTKLQNLLDDARYWVDQNTYPEKELAVRFHHRLVEIHPFVNGNGRHARIMADIILTKEMNVEPIDWAGGYDMKSVKCKRRKEYIAALRKADQGDYRPLLDFVGS